MDDGDDDDTDDDDTGLLWKGGVIGITPGPPATYTKKKHFTTLAAPEKASAETITGIF